MATEDGDAETELLDYEEEENDTAADGVQAVKEAAKKDVKGTYVSIHSSGFRDFLLKPELLRAIVDCGFEHPSEGRFRAFFPTLVVSLFAYCFLMLEYLQSSSLKAYSAFIDV